MDPYRSITVTEKQTEPNGPLWIHLVPCVFCLVSVLAALEKRIFLRTTDISDYFYSWLQRSSDSYYYARQ